LYLWEAVTGAGTEAEEKEDMMGIEEHLTLDSPSQTLEVFPNPAKTYFTVRFPLSADRSSIKLFDVSGKEIRCLRFDVASAPSTLRVTLDGIKNGVYFIRVGNELIREKLVITK